MHGQLHYIPSTYIISYLYTQSDLETYYPKFYVSEYDNHKNLRTNLTFNAYVNSATA